MSIRNKTKKSHIVSKHRICTSAWCKALGLMFHTPISDYALVFEFEKPQRPALHNFFVFFPIDILFLDEKYKVVDLKESFMPFSLYLRPRHTCKYVVELPALAIENSKTKKGDILQVK